MYPGKIKDLFKKHLITCLALISVVAITASAQYPNISWKSNKSYDSFHIEIAKDQNFDSIVDKDQIMNVPRYVPSDALNPGDYYWRVTNETGDIKKGSFIIKTPEIEITIPEGSTMKQIEEAISKSKNYASSRIVFSPGTYHLYPQKGKAVFSIYHAKNLQIDGQNATFIIHTIAGVAEVAFSQNITLSNFTIDYGIPLYAAAKVEKIDSLGIMHLSLWNGCEPPESMDFIMEERRGMFYQPEFPRMAENVPLLVYMKDAWKPLGEGRYCLQAVNPKDVINVKPGMVYICAPRLGVQGFSLYNSNDITIADVTTYYLPGIGVTSTLVDDLKLIRLNILRRADRFLGLQNGGTNIHNAAIGPWVEGCRFENTGDDNNHLSALSHIVIEQPDKRTVVFQNQFTRTQKISDDLGIRVGDVLAFFDRNKGALLVEAIVNEVVVLKNSTTKVVFDRDIPSEVSPKNSEIPDTEVIQVYNLSRACGNFVFRNNTFIRGRRIGILAKSGPGLIENNRFEELGTGGIEIWNAPVEGLYGHDIIITNNEFIGGGLVFRNKGFAPAIWADIFAGDPSQRLHRNLFIENNRIVDYPGDCIVINDAVNLRIRNNLFENNHLTHLRYPEAKLIRLSNVENYDLKGNHNRDERFNGFFSVEVNDTVKNMDDN